MNCLICNRKVERSDLSSKISCSDCNKFFHCSCVNLSQNDLNFLLDDGKKYRCDKCSMLRRKSLQQQELSGAMTHMPTTQQQEDETHLNKEIAKKLGTKNINIKQQTQQQQLKSIHKQQQQSVTHSQQKPTSNQRTKETENLQFNISPQTNQLQQQNRDPTNKQQHQSMTHIQHKPTSNQNTKETESKQFNTSQPQTSQQLNRDLTNKQQHELTIEQDHQQVSNKPTIQMCLQPTLTTISLQTKSSNSTGNISNQLLYEEILKLQNMHDDFRTMFQAVKAENENLKKRVNNLESRLNWREQKLLENEIELVGLPNVNNENAQECVKKILKESLGISTSSNEILKCYIKKTKKRNNSNIDTICVKLSSTEIKNKIMISKRNAKHKLNASVLGGEKKKNIFINDRFTKYTAALFMSAKKIKMENRLKYLWFKNSKILLRKVDGGEVMVIKSFDDLESIKSSLIC